MVAMEPQNKALLNAKFSTFAFDHYRRFIQEENTTPREVCTRVLASLEEQGPNENSLENLRSSHPLQINLQQIIESI